MKLRKENKERKGLALFFYRTRIIFTYGIIPSWWDFKRGLRNLRIWFPHVWNYADYDGVYTIEMLIASLEFQRDRLKNYSREIPESLSEKISDIELVIALLKKSKDSSNYTSDITKHFDDIYGEDEMYFKPFKFDENNNPILFSMESTRKDSLSTEEYEKYLEESKQMNDEAMKLMEDDRKKAFLIIAEKITGWWE